MDIKRLSAHWLCQAMVKFAERHVSLFHTLYVDHTGHMPSKMVESAYKDHYNVYIPCEATYEEMDVHLRAFISVEVADIQFDRDEWLCKKEKQLLLQDERAQHQVKKLKKKVSVFSSAGKRKQMELSDSDEGSDS